MSPGGGPAGGPRESDALLAWYDRHRRDLPWRRTLDPWAILVSEFMLQQTRVETVIPYYERFMERFPEPAALAAVEVEELLGLWSGLGYYRRARRLHAAACRIVAVGGEFPSTMAGLLDLPGVGPYTAAAVGSIAFGLVEPVVDGNVERVVGRLLALEVDPRRSGGRSLLLERVGSLIDPSRPGDSNQAMMELGATVCSARAPRCGSCPLSGGCAALSAGDPEGHPPARVRRAVRRRRLLAAVVVEGDRVLLFRRSEDERLLAGLWELPWVELPAGDGSSARARRGGGVEEELSKRYGGSWKLGAPLARTRHAITHRMLEVEAVAAEIEPAEEMAEGPEAGWFSGVELDRTPVSSLVGKVLKSSRLA